MYLCFNNIKLQIHTMPIIHLQKPVSDIERAEHCFKGECLIYKNISAMHELIEYADKLLRESLNGIDPVDAQLHFSPEAFLQRTGNVQAHFRKSETVKELFFKVLEECGVDLNNTYYDHFPMRIVPFDTDYDGAECGVIGHHRDSWGSNIHSQINWWAPLYALEENRTIALYPDYWDKPIANTTATWSHKDYLEKRNEADAERQGCYPSAPTLKASVDESNLLKVMLEPGDVLSFSSAHLHASVPNTTKATRYSVEMRSINKHDLESGRAAPNVDNAATTPMYQWFKHILSKEKLKL